MASTAAAMAPADVCICVAIRLRHVTRLLRNHICQNTTQIFISGLGALKLKRTAAQLNLQHAAFHCPGALFNRLTLWSGKS